MKAVRVEIGSEGENVWKYGWASTNAEGICGDRLFSGLIQSRILSERKFENVVFGQASYFARGSVLKFNHTHRLGRSFTALQL